MKVIGVISSPHFEGNTATLVREALQGAQEGGAATTEIFLPNYRVEYCSGCFKCMSEGNCPLSQDDFGKLRDLLYEAGGIIWGSPTYGGTYNARMKTLFERFGLFERFTSTFGGKYMIGIAPSNGSGRSRTAKELTAFSCGVFKRGYVSGTLEVGLRGGKKAAQQPEILDRARRLGRKMAQDITKHKTYPWQNIPLRMVNYLFLKPGFQKAIVAHREGALEAVYLNLRQREVIR